jgi:hypothetical protein
MLYSEIIGVCSQIHTKHINTLCGQNVESLGAFTKLWKASSHMSIRMENSDSIGRIFMKFDMNIFSKISRWFKFN